jgi:hypothetical protein
MPNFDLKLRISPSEKEFSIKFGKDIYNSLKSETLKRDNYICQGGCEFRTIQDSPKDLYCHIVEVNEQEPLKSICVSLCKYCHMTQHIDIAVENDYIQFVNSTYSQAVLNKMEGTSSYGVNEHNTRSLYNPEKGLKSTPAEWLKRIKENTLSKNSKIKITFTDNFKNFGKPAEAIKDWKEISESEINEIIASETPMDDEYESEFLNPENELD